MAVKGDIEASVTCTDSRRGGWKTFPFVTASSLTVGIVSYGVLANMLVYLKQQFNFDSIDATLIVSIVGGGSELSPLLAAIVADSCVGCFSVILASTAASFLGMLLFTLTAAVPSLSPPICSPTACELPTKSQLAVLYAASALMVVGFGGTHYVAATMGAVQFDSTDDRSTFFNWYTVSLYVSMVLGLAGIIYVQENAGWVWGFGLCAAISGAGLLIFLLGTRYYRHPERKRNPLVAFVRTALSSGENKRMAGRVEDGATESQTLLVTTRSQEQPLDDDAGNDDLNTILKLVPLLSTSILYSISSSTQGSFTILQALVMDRRIIGRFSVPAASMPVFIAIAAAFFIPILNSTVYPFWARICRSPPTPLQRMGSGLLIIPFTMSCTALIESRRLGAAANSGEPVSVFWLLPGLVLMGLQAALLAPALLEFYYQEFPKSLESSATGVTALVAGIGGCLSTAIIALVRRFTGWLQDDTNQSRLDNVYWLLAVMGVLNFGYFLVCSKFYKNGNLSCRFLK